MRRDACKARDACLREACRPAGDANRGAGRQPSPPGKPRNAVPLGTLQRCWGGAECPADAPPQLPLYKLPHNQQACSPQHQFPQQKRLAWVTGEKRTQDTHSVWPSGSPMVYLHSPAGRRGRNGEEGSGWSAAAAAWAYTQRGARAGVSHHTAAASGRQKMPKNSSFCC